jgi:HSP20 family protein
MDLAERMYMQDFKSYEKYIPSTDIFEDDKEWIIRSEIPGVKKEDISISFEDSVLKIEAKKEMKTKVETEKEYLSEIKSGKYERKFKLANGIDSENIEATYENGVLELKVPKKQEKEKQIEIKIK